MAAPHPNPLPARGARGRALREVGGERRGPRQVPFAPFTGRRCRQADEGPSHGKPSHNLIPQPQPQHRVPAP
ncbi:hypothetical protein E0H39_18390 [Rhizobium leguminosarum bv. viciae]|nr:hypothetical protein [Rhizobium leguminosarum bv. viciae]PUB60113.1 hypothetical protein DB728_34175 [Rhizobium leguminosarum bv. viciae USDA 2370]NKK16744.1 hypothetical protein [Rhizobium leguminosarum bv. viciae]NKK30480.1 hypothetical protein [Rhizobium leguminosarum bv. viciae]NKK37850.1 hypothetical protein [Rhizobium leguminosarum bv. viciae]